MFSALKEYSSQERLIGIITNEGQKDSFKVIAVDSITEKVVKEFTFQTENAQLFLSQISTIPKKLFKAVIVNLFGLEFTDETFNVSYKFCEELKKQFNENGILSYFIAEESYLFTTLLIAANIDPSKLDGTLLLILPHQKAHHYPGNRFGVTVAEFEYTPVGYKLLKHQQLTTLNTKERPEILCSTICGSSNPQKIIIGLYNCPKINFKKIFKTKEHVIVNFDASLFHERFVIEKCKWLLDRSYSKFHILPTCAKTIRVYAYYGTPANFLDIVKVNVNEALPVEKTAVFIKSLPELHVMYGDKQNVFGRKFTPLKSSHGFRITVIVDEENFEKLIHSQASIPNITNLPSKLNDLIDSKIPFIGFYDNSTVMGLYVDSKKTYEFLDEWNGQYGIDSFISFTQKKPLFGQEAMESLKAKNTCVVFDFLKIMSMPSDDIKADKIWGFTFTKDMNNPVLLEFLDYGGKVKNSSPAFLMAMLIKQHLKVLTTKLGEKPTRIALCIFNKEYKEDEMNRIKEGLKESCRLLKIEGFFIPNDSYGIDFKQFGAIR